MLPKVFVVVSRTVSLHHFDVSFQFQGLGDVCGLDSYHRACNARLICGQNGVRPSSSGIGVDAVPIDADVSVPPLMSAAMVPLSGSLHSGMLAVKFKEKGRLSDQEIKVTLHKLASNTSTVYSPAGKEEGLYPFQSTVWGATPPE